jgi:hypothetical protein
MDPCAFLRVEAGMTRLVALLMLVTTATAGAQPVAVTWGTDEPTHTRLLGQGLTGKSLAAVEKMLAAEGFHEVRTRLTMSGTAVPTLHQGTLSVVYETTVQQPACPPGAPCRQVRPATVLVELGCDQYVATGSKIAISCDGLRGISVIPQP